MISYARKIGLTKTIAFDPPILRVEDRIRHYCREDKCGQYRKHRMCPPLVGTLTETRAWIREYGRGILFQDVTELDVKNDRGGVEDTKRLFHEHILDIEHRMKHFGVSNPFGLIGGHCVLCEPYKAVRGDACPFPDRARPSRPWKPWAWM